MELNKSLDEMKPAVETIVTAVPVVDVAPAYDRPLFEGFYDDWASFDAAIARATAAYHPIRKRSSLTFEVYNRTVSKGKHDRKNIAEFLSKTFKCTHGIKFRSRGSGKRMRHKLRDIGCPFHVYASAVEYGTTYRVKVRTHDKHNHPIGPDSMKMMSGALHESDYELATHDGGDEAASTGQQNAESAAVNTHVHQMEHAISSENHDNSAEAAQAAYELQMREQLAEAEAHARAQAQAHAEVQAQADADARAQAEAQSQAYQYVQAQAMLKAQAEVQAMTDAQAQDRAQAMLQSQHNHTQGQPQSVDILSASGHDNELLDGAIDSTMGDEVFPGSSAAQSTTTDVACAANSNIQGDCADGVQSPAKFEETMTLESLRKRIADFADERDWNQFHTPRNLLLALNGEVGELCEIFQWKGEVKNTADWSARDKEHLGEEISDVLIYLVRLADKCDVNLPAALNDKIAKNARKYPADLVKGSSKKYNEYKRMRITEESTL
ncbi:dCTP pyrophosphatase 1 [Phytophthora pseudosyringae]|uniref:dCTP pyrophosphatase 1 n=1 Tax=Phytophthora pseudosyringae TaxID=221518 RepID=A0A8T1VZH0_9STRA|nr:dCTP pyrophosphatase 1 [Phytophthora pseudosyringae]